MMRRKMEYLNDRKFIFHFISQINLEGKRLETVMLLANLTTEKSK